MSKRKNEILSAERLAEIRANRERLAIAIGIDRRLTPEEEIAAEKDLAAILAHIDALTAGAVDAKALGRDLWGKIAPHVSSGSRSLRDALAESAAALFTLGRAAGRSEGAIEELEALARLQSESEFDDGIRWMHEALNAHGVAHVPELPGVLPRLRLGLEAKDAEIARLTAELATRTAERDEARGWVRRLTATERVLTCAFCGEAYPPGTPESNHERLMEHVKVCAKHPMRDVERERDAARLNGAREEREALSIRFEQLSRLEHDRGDRCAASETDADEAPLHYAASDAFGAAAKIVRARGAQ